MKNPSRNVMDFLSIYLFPFIWITFFKIYFKLKNDFYYFSMNTKYIDENLKLTSVKQSIILSQKPITYIAKPCYFSSFFTGFKIFCFQRRQ